MAVGGRNLAGVARALVPWLHDRLPGAQHITLPTPRAPAEGGSSETFFLEPTIVDNGATRSERWVLRIQASTNQIYQDAAVERQYRILEALAAANTVPVPSVLWFEPDPGIIGAPFFVMQRVVGQIPSSFHHSDGYLVGLAAAEREVVWVSALQAMAQVEAVPLESVEFLARPELGPTGLDQDLAAWDSYATWSGIVVRPVQERAREWLADHMPIVRPTALAWGDARPGNMIFQTHRCAAIIDWETVSLAGGESDLGWWLFYDWFMSDGFAVPRLDGVPGRDATIRIWESFAGRAARDLEWHEVCATWRFSLISDRARMLMRGRGEPDPLGVSAETPHARRLAMLIGR